ncbi:MAG: cupin domain-containing protein [Magnetococcales bacterium]|nr:cupin domain-containing protein [Magnetococcales bacterium]NGZ25861.1 cupin domain-containing protein [Magnetococcales bacterium]
MGLAKGMINGVIGSCFFLSMAWAGDYQITDQLLETSSTIIGEKIVYPGGGEAHIKSLVVVIPPGEVTKWHKHGVPLYAHVLAGTLTVDYGDRGKRVYKTGDTFMEAMDHWHRGQNDGSETVRILTVYMGGNQQAPVIPKPEQ